MNAEEWNERGRQALNEQDYAKAIACFEKAIVAEPDWSVPHYNLGLAHKFEKRWPECLAANYRAYQLNPEDPASTWNLGISAAAVSDWDKAAEAYRAIGLTVPDDVEPPWDFRMGLIPIRVCPDEHPEVVWCHRLDPVRARIANIPLPACGRRYGDIILNDGAPNGYRELNGKEVPVFDELEVLQESSFHTFQLEVPHGDEDSLKNLMTLFEEYRVPAENWTHSLRYLCRACSEGRPHEQHDEELRAETPPEIRLGLAARDQAEISKVLERWSGNVLSLALVL
jgi:tetratricopeptide (TPR) repeat protein